MRRLLGIGWGMVPWLGILTVLAILCASVLHAAPPSTVTPDTAVDYRTASAFFPFIQQDSVGTGGATLLCISSQSGRILPNYLELPDTPVPYVPVGVPTSSTVNRNYGIYGVPINSNEGGH